MISREMAVDPCRSCACLPGRTNESLAMPTPSPASRFRCFTRLELLLVLVFLVVPLASSRAAGGPEEGSRPNMVLILADDLGYGDVGYYDSESKVLTPNLDRLASHGMRFTDAHSPATVCTPSRYSLMTGQMAFRVPNGGRVFQGADGPSLIAPGRLTLPAMLRRLGYATAAVGKWHVGLTFRDQAGEPIHRGRPEDVGRIDFSRRVEGVRWIMALSVSLARLVVPPPTGSTPSSRESVCPCRPRVSSTSRSFRGTRIPLIAVPGSSRRIFRWGRQWGRRQWGQICPIDNSKAIERELAGGKTIADLLAPAVVPAQASQTAAGMLRLRRLGRGQDLSPQDPFQFSDRL